MKYLLWTCGERWVVVENPAAPLQRVCLVSRARVISELSVCRAILESLLDSGIIHFGFSIGAVQPVINVKGDELFAGKELIKKWSSRETAY